MYTNPGLSHDKQYDQDVITRSLYNQLCGQIDPSISGINTNLTKFHDAFNLF